MKKNSTLIGKLFIVGLFGVIVLWREDRGNHLKDTGIILNAHTIEFVGYKTRGIKYEFYYKQEKEIGSSSPDKIYGNVIFLDKSFPVIYDPNSGISRILIDPADFKTYNISFPDSLNWVLPYFK